jgi:hypothetical protein
VLMHVGTPSERWVCTNARRIMSAMVHSTIPPAPTHTRRLRRLPHTLLIIQHTIFPFRTRSFALGVWVSIRERTNGYYHRTYWELTARFGVAQEWEEWRRWLHWWAGDELPPMVPAHPNEVRDATSSYLI